jgi:hypothetical protein
VPQDQNLDEDRLKRIAFPILTGKSILQTAQETGVSPDEIKRYCEATVAALGAAVSEADNQGAPPETLRTLWREGTDEVGLAFKTRFRWGVMALLLRILDTFTLQTVVHLGPATLGLIRTRRAQHLLDDIYTFAILGLSLVVVITRYALNSNLIGLVAAIRLEEMAVIFLSLLAGLTWTRPGSMFSVYRVLFEAIQIPLLLAVLAMAFASDGFSGLNPSTASGMSYVYIMVTNMATLGNAYNPVGPSAQTLTAIAPLLGLLLFGAVLSVVVARGRP